MVNVGTNYKKLGTKLKQLRKERKITQEELAERANLDPKSIIQIESGKRNPTLKTINKIARSLETSVSDLI